MLNNIQALQTNLEPPEKDLVMTKLRQMIASVATTAAALTGTSTAAGRSPRRRRGRQAASIALASALTAGAVTATPLSAHADTIGALNRCRSGAVGDARFTGAIRDIASGTLLGWTTANGNAVGLLLNGAVIRVRASGGIKTDGWPWTPYFPPNGVIDRAPSDWPAPTLNKMSLVGRMNWGPTNTETKGYRFLGTDSGCFLVAADPSRPEILIASINDNFSADNSGTWNITLDQFYPERW